MEKSYLGIIGLGVMGKNLALNAQSKGYTVSLFDMWLDRIEDTAKAIENKDFTYTYSLPEFISSLHSPRKILIMVKAGKPVDDIIDQLIPLLEKGDIIIDGGNSYFVDTIRRNEYLEEKGIMFVGMGISGGEEGALKGPSIMPGCKDEAYLQMESMLTAIAAKVDGEPCCTHIGPDGSGHYVKMVHNGIEYADMQLICEAYSMLKDILRLTSQELCDVFREWNAGELNSYLVEITGNIFSKIDPETGITVVDVILDKAGQKGTGKWTGQNSLDLGVCTPTITEAVYARYISVIKSERVAANKIYKTNQRKYEGDRKEFIEAVRKALYASKICTYAQGFSLMKAAAEEYGWSLDYGNIAKIFRGGCIIRAQFLNKIKEAFERNAGLPNLLLAPYFANILKEYQDAWREAVMHAASFGIPVPAFFSALSYFDSYRKEELPVNLLQAQRDYFGAHTFERIDREGIFHYKWF